MSVVEEDIPAALAMTAFAGISWYIGIEISISLFLLFKRRRGLYFWSCALGIWGVILQTLFIILADFGIWTDMKASITMIYLSWSIMVIPQSWILYSRLHLITQQRIILNWVLAALIFNSIVFGIPTIPLGVLTQTVKPSLYPVNNVWDRLQTAMFFVQETTLSVLYIWQTRVYMRDLTPLLEPQHPSSSSTHTMAKIEKKKSILRDLIRINILIICLDITLLGIQNGNLFYLAGAFKPAVYGVKLKLEFVILNRLIKSLRHNPGSTTQGSHDGMFAESAGSESAGVNANRAWDGQRPSTANNGSWQPKQPTDESTFDMVRLDADRSRWGPHSQDSQAPIIPPSSTTAAAVRDTESRRFGVR
ncbi:hypothetical protein F4804DRAFT_87601 [Jackrogersella minutella]|nr:hypothetical protein F4804DRAFT_87601 [Jackrogersella minutella]